MKHVVITGAANGVGKAIANLLKNEKLILIDQDEIHLKHLANDLNANYFLCDVSNEQQIIDLMQKLRTDFEKIDCLINCAGMWIAGEISKTQFPIYQQMNEVGRIKKVIDANIFGTIAMIKSIFPIMQKQGYGQIININSQSGVICEPEFPIYNASKTGANTFRKAIQNDLAKHNIRITDICPGLIKTDFYKRANNELPESVMNNGLLPSDVANTVKYIMDLPHEITIPCIEVRHIKNY